MFEIMYPPNTRAWGRSALFMQSHEATLLSTWSPYVGGAAPVVCHYVPDASAAGHARGSTISLGETRSAQANTKPREYHGRAASSAVRRRHPSVHTKPFVCVR